MCESELVVMEKVELMKVIVEKEFPRPDGLSGEAEVEWENSREKRRAQLARLTLEELQELAERKTERPIMATLVLGLMKMFEGAPTALVSHPETLEEILCATGLELVMRAVSKDLHFLSREKRQEIAEALDGVLEKITGKRRGKAFHFLGAPTHERSPDDRCC